MKASGQHLVLIYFVRPEVGYLDLSQGGCEIFEKGTGLSPAASYVQR